MKHEGVPARYRNQAERIALIAESHQRLLGRPLVDGDDLVLALWESEPAIVAHGTQPDPVFFFGNRTALELFEADAATFTALPSRKSAEVPLRAERETLMERVRAQGFIDDYSGIRISLGGKRFRIEQAIVWNLADAQGQIHGQAAMFDNWTPMQ